MKQPFENSCLKGCLIYVVALALILVLSVVGLGSIGARFGGGAGTQPAKPSLAASSAASGDQPAPTAAPAPNGNPQAVTQVDQAALQPTPTSAPAATAPDPSPTALAPPPVQAQPPAPVEQPAQAAPAPAADSAPQI